MRAVFAGQISGAGADIDLAKIECRLVSIGKPLVRKGAGQGIDNFKKKGGGGCSSDQGRIAGAVKIAVEKGVLPYSSGLGQNTMNSTAPTIRPPLPKKKVRRSVTVWL